MVFCKTHKATSKRIRISGTGKFMRRKCGQDHFNSRDRGNVKRRKRNDLVVPKGETKKIKKLIVS